MTDDHGLPLHLGYPPWPFVSSWVINCRRQVINVIGVFFLPGCVCYQRDKHFLFISSEIEVKKN